MKQVIVIENGKYFCKGKAYDEISILKNIGKSVEFIILEEAIFIKEFNNIKKVKESLVRDIVNVEYGNDLDILTHYEYCKASKTLFLYSVKNGNSVSRLAENINDILVIPIQFYIKDFILKKANKLVKKEKYYIIFVLIRETVYLLEIENNIIVKSKIEKEKYFSFNDKLRGYGNKIKIIIDEKLNHVVEKGILEDFNISTINIGGEINEKIFEV